MSEPTTGGPLILCPHCGREEPGGTRFCRQCGLPTIRQAQAHKQVPSLPPDTAELKRGVPVTLVWIVFLGAMMQTRWAHLFH